MECLDEKVQNVEIEIKDNNDTETKTGDNTDINCNMAMVLLNIIIDDYPSVSYQVISQLSIAITTISYTIVIFLMMDDNVAHYLRFLKVMYHTRLRYICCCWAHTITDQIDELVGDNTEHGLKEIDEYIESTKFETRTNDDEYGEKRITTNCMELSVITETKPIKCHNDD